MKATIETTHTVFRAFADETRLRLLNLLLDRELCVCELCEVLRMSQPKISRHLAYLRRAKLVTVRSEGKWKFYEVSRRPGGLVKTLLDCVGTCLREIDVLQRDLERLDLVSRAGSCAR